MNVPLITITLDHMRHTLQHALLDHAGELRRQIAETVERQISAEALESEIASQLHTVLREELKSAIRYAVVDALAKTELRAQLAELVADEVKRGILARVKRP